MKTTIIITSILSLVFMYLASTITELPYYAGVPFILMLLSIAIIPLINSKWWHHNFTKVSIVIGAPMALAVMVYNWHWLYHTAIEYIAFIALLASLFIISGGILLKENIKVSSSVNAFVLLIGAILASLIGTTGAAMLLIRPIIRLNKERKNKAHVIIFFIFIVANIGGSLTPFGDPPLFLGFLKGVPFFWTLNLFPAWLFNNVVLITMFFIIDHLLLRKEHVHNKKEEIKKGKKLIIEGKINFLFLLGIIAGVLIYSKLPDNMNLLLKDLIQILIFGTMVFLSLKFTPKKYREQNGFTWFPIKEVAILFAAIFASMIPLLKILELKGQSLGITEPWQFFWLTGALSSFLDNAPTYLTFLSTSKTVSMDLIYHGASYITLKDGSLVAESLLLAISMGAVFMGANTYIGNGPNFMVKSISEDSGIKMPSFFGYMMWSILILIPLFLLNVVLFLK
jgi:Na+/H+ antiporter NhaD/arsenite permease-like protein